MRASVHALRAIGLVTMLLLLVMPGCGESGTPTSPPDGAVFLIYTCGGIEPPPAGEAFRVLIRDPGVISEADSYVGAGFVKLVTGKLVRGAGGFNRPWSWHLDPSTVRFVGGAVEICDGCPSHVEGDLDYWIGTVGFYCPKAIVAVRER